MEQERAFFDSLRRTAHYQANGQKLVLESANSVVVLTFSRCWRVATGHTFLMSGKTW